MSMKENVPDLQFDLFFNFSGHSGSDLALREFRLNCWKWCKCRG